MIPVFTLEPLPKSIFLAGPTPKDERGKPWRPEALAILEELKFDGRVFIAENAGWRLSEEHKEAQVAWEWEALNLATVVVFWVPRDLEHMPAMTTNVEFGLMAASGKAMLGYPSDAPKMLYLERLAHRYNMPVFGDLRETLTAAVARARRPFRVGPPRV